MEPEIHNNASHTMSSEDDSPISRTSSSSSSASESSHSHTAEKSAMCGYGSDVESNSDNDDSSSSSDDEDSKSVKPTEKTIAEKIQECIRFRFESSIKLITKEINMRDIEFQWLKQDSNTIFIREIKYTPTMKICKVEKTIHYEKFEREEIDKLATLTSEWVNTLFHKHIRQIPPTDDLPKKQQDQFVHYKNAFRRIKVMILNNLYEHGFNGMTDENLGFYPSWALYTEEKSDNLQGVKINTTKTLYKPPAAKSISSATVSPHQNKRGRKPREKDVPYEWSMYRYAKKKKTAGEQQQIHSSYKGHFTIIIEKKTQASQEENVLCYVYWGDQDTKKRKESIQNFAQWYANTFNGSYNRFKKNMQKKKAGTESIQRDTQRKEPIISANHHTATSSEDDDNEDHNDDATNTNSNSSSESEAEDDADIRKRRKQQDKDNIIAELQKKTNSMANQIEILNNLLKIKSKENAMLQELYEEVSSLKSHKL